MDFNQIVLSKSEFSALKALKKAHDNHCGILVEPKNQTALERLAHFELAVIQMCTSAPPGITAKWPMTKEAHITERGLDYLAYLNGQMKDKRSSRRHDVFLLLIAALIAIFFDHIGELFNLIRAFLDFRHIP